MASPTGSAVRRAFGSGTLLLLAVAGTFGLVTLLPLPWGPLLGLAGVALGAALRSLPSTLARGGAPVPPLVALGLLAALAPVSELTELYAGLAALAFLLWLADDPARLPGGAGRGLRIIAVPALGFGLAWASSLLVPAVGSSVGLAVALLVGVGAVVAFLLRAPAAFDRDPAATS
jgi:hypothetical protein